MVILQPEPRVTKVVGLPRGILKTGCVYSTNKFFLLSIRISITISIPVLSIMLKTQSIYTYFLVLYTIAYMPFLPGKALIIAQLAQCCNWFLFPSISTSFMTLASERNKRNAEGEANAPPPAAWVQTINNPQSHNMFGGGGGDCPLVGSGWIIWRYVHIH